MARFKGVAVGLLPDRWPGWLLAFGRGWHDDEAVQEVIRAQHASWRVARAAWLAEHRPDLSDAAFSLLAAEERRRRVSGVC